MNSFQEAVAMLKVGQAIIDEVNNFPSSKCQCCGHKIMLLNKKYNRDVEPYLFHNWQKKCWCGCSTPIMENKELRDLKKWVKKQKELEGSVKK